MTLEGRIEAKIGTLLDQMDESDGEGRPKLSAAQMLAAMGLALKYLAFKRQIDEGDGWGGALNDGGENGQR